MHSGLSDNIRTVSYTHLDVYKRQGYDWIEQEYDVQVVREEEKKVELLGSCGASRGA